MSVLSPFGPTPNARQLAWHKHEFYGFLHFGINTFTGKQWGYGDESPHLFNPSDFDADQIVKTAKQSGMAGLILTCKHHDGFCLWPSPYTEHSIKNSPWKNGQGDMVKEISEACLRHKIKFGVYLSPWDRNHSEYGRADYLDYFQKQLEELTSQYGELFEVWFDGANGGDGYYGGANEMRSIDRKTYYDWQNTYQIVRRNQPNAVIFTNCDIRWVGNEEGFANEPCWHTVSSVSKIDRLQEKTVKEDDMVKAWDEHFELLGSGERHGDIWRPAECDVSIRPNWFYDEKEDDQVRSPENLWQLYLKSVGRSASLLLNLPLDQRGQIHPNDQTSLLEFKTLLDSKLGNAKTGIVQSSSEFSAQHLSGHTQRDDECFWSPSEQDTTPYLQWEFESPTQIGLIKLSEYLPLGQRVDEFEIHVKLNNQWVKLKTVQSIGAHRILELPLTQCQGIKVVFSQFSATPAIRLAHCFG